MRCPRTFVWGSTDNGRLGTEAIHERGAGVRRYRRWIDVPVELTRSFPENGRGSTWGQALRDSLMRRVSGRRVEDGGGEEDMLSGTGIVELQAGGWSFTARDMEGGVWVWGKFVRLKRASYKDVIHGIFG